ncbi:MAG: adenylate/guanylate cyclase domain-containing protein [Lachnospiraceae bacterium]|nr:adenylate/guanylate cyclase domain-containing protein [Lachnospiraceae bacterium]
MKTARIRPLASALAVACLLTLLAGAGLLDKLDRAASDAWYQTRSAPEEDIVLVGIDQRAVDEIGPYQQWGRDVIAMALEALNESEDCRPAAIAIDVLYVGESDPDADEWLAEAAGTYGNVVTACAAQFDDTFVEDGQGSFRRDRFAIQAFEEPFDALREVTTQGHINAMLDTDGILRHHLLYLTLPDGTYVPSMALAAARMYQEYHGLEPVQLPPTDANGFWYVPFTGLPGDFDAGISVADLILGDIPAEEFAGKVVFIGPYTVGLQDSYVSAADHSRQMYGVEYQANAVQAILWGEPKQEVNDSYQLAILFLLLLIGFAGFWKRSVRLATALWLLLSGGWLLLCKVLYGQGLVLRLLWVPIGVTILYVGCIAFNYIQSALEKRKVTKTFQRYVDPEIVKEILERGADTLELDGKLTDIAVLFVDIRGFTTMSEKLKPNEVVAILNRYLSLIADCILTNGGTLDKFVGDAAMAFWGAPLPQDDYVMHAVQAAADMVNRSQALSQELMQEFGRTVSFGVGVHVGDAVVGNIGSVGNANSPDRMDYTAIGDTVNTAARLEANAPAGTIYISREVADRLEGRIRVTSLGDTIKLKGKADGFEVLVMEEILSN